MIMSKTYLCAGFICMCMVWTPATLKYDGARFRQKSHSYSVDRTPIFLICLVNFSSTYALQEWVIVNFILFTRAKFSCCWFFRILITASAINFFELPFDKVTFLWLDWRLLPTACWSEFADRHTSSHLNSLILWTYRSWTLHLDSRRFEICCSRQI